MASFISQFQIDSNATSKNMELNDLRISICLRKSEVSVERVLVCDVTEKLMQPGKHCFPCSNTNEIGFLSKQLPNYSDVKVASSWHHSAKVQSTTVGNSIYILVIYLWQHWCRNLEKQNLPCSTIFSKTLHTKVLLTETSEFLKQITIIPHLIPCC